MTDLYTKHDVIEAAAQEASTSNKEMDVEYDLGNLSMYNSQHVDFPEDAAGLEATIQDVSIKNFRRLFGKLLELKGKEDVVRDAKKLELQIHDFDKTEFHINLPEGTTLFPRFNPMPSEKDLTKWEKFAKEKGIRKVKRKSMKVFDEASQTWVNRFGSAGMTKLKERRDVVREYLPGQDRTVDLFQEDRDKKRGEQQKQQIAEIKNRIKAKGHDASKVVSSEERFQRVKLKKEKLKKIKALKQEKLAANLRIAQSSTASMGRFDKKVSKDEVKKKVGKKKQNVSMFFDARKEIDRNKGS